MNGRPQPADSTSTASPSEAGPSDPKRPDGDGPTTPFGAGVRLGRIFGVQVSLDISLLVIFGLIATTLALGTFPTWHPDWSAVTHWGVALVAAVLFLASVLAHELSHAVVGRSLGVEVRGITLFMFGGIASMGEESRSPKGEFLMTIVGPLTSLLIGVAGIWAGVGLAGNPELMRSNPQEFVKTLGPVASVLVWLGPVNVLLAVFNMIPGFPLDGGRVLRSLIWWATDDLQKATLWASRVGQLFGFLFIATGIFMALGGFIPVLGGGFLNGLWLALIGWFLTGAAKASYAQLIRRELLSGTPVRRMMRQRVESVPSSASVSELVEGPVMQTDQRSFPVYDGERWVGLVTVEDVRQLSKSEWDTTSVADVMTPRAELATVNLEADADQTLQRMMREGQDQIPVVDRGEVRGFVRQQDIVKWLTLQRPQHA
jgi:Zn-dependent protease